jgi:hypothetical protein
MSAIRYLGGLAATLLMAVAGAPCASAAPPDIERTPKGTQTILHEECGFDVLEETKAGQSLFQTFSSPDGDVRVHVAGSFHGTLTNVETGESIQINFSGAGGLDFETGALTGHGPWLIGSPDNSDTPEFDGYMVLLHGNSEASIDFETGVVVIESATSPVTDLCAALD